jgi:hypothetical protein
VDSDLVELELLLLAVELVVALESLDFLASDDELSLLDDSGLLAPLAEALEAERESVMYQPLPLKTMPTGWITFRSVPPHCSHVVRGGSEKLWRFSITSLQAVQV